MNYHLIHVLPLRRFKRRTDQDGHLYGVLSMVMKSTSDGDPGSGLGFGVIFIDDELSEQAAPRAREWLLRARSPPFVGGACAVGAGSLESLGRRHGLLRLTRPWLAV